MSEIKDILQLHQAKLELEANLQEAMFEAIRKGDYESIKKAETIMDVEKQRNSTGQKSYLIDPNFAYNANGYKDNNFRIGYDLLRRVSYSTPVNFIINTRIEQVAAFAVPQRDIYSTGFVIIPKPNSKNNNTKYSKEQEKEIERITDFVLNAGITEHKYTGTTFDSIIRQIVRDSLSFDQMTFEIVWNNYGWKNEKKGRPARFVATDATLFRYANNIDIFDSQGLDYPAYVQIKDGQVFEHFYKPELCFGVRNISTDVYRNGYGRSELEDMIFEITSFLWATEYNRNYFKNGSMPKGMLKIKGDVGSSRLTEFKRKWEAMVGGVGNAWKTPIVEADSIDWVDMGKSNSDMEFNKWIEFLIKIICAAYKIDPSEVGFNLGSGSEAKVAFESNNEARLKHSKDKGLYPLLKFIQHQITKYIVEPLNPEYVFQFVGLEGLTKAEELDLRKKESETFKTINEVRADYGLEPVDGGDIIANAQFMQAWTLNQQGGEQSNEMMDEEYEEGGGEEENPFEKALQEDLEKLFYSE